MDLILQQMKERVSNDRVDGDAGHFDAVMLQGELVTKLTLLGALAFLDPNIDNHYRYDVEYSLVRANGIGAWTYELQRLITGPAKSAFRRDAGKLITQLSQRVGTGSSAWQRVALDELALAEAALGIGRSDAKSKTALTSFFSRFSILRNKSRHRAQHVSNKGTAASHLGNAVETIVDNLDLLHASWFACIRKSAGSARAYPLSSEMRDRIAVEPELVSDVLSECLNDSVYILFGNRALSVHLVHPREPLDVFVANGDYSDAKCTYEAISYIHGEKTDRIGATDFLAPPSLLADSETHGLVELDVQGQTWANLPLRKPDYVTRRDIERELRERLLDRETDPIITLGGPGGIGKTSTALQVLHDLADEGSFDLILWFSSRDIDLLDVEGAVPVKPRVLTFNDAANDFSRMTAAMGFDALNPESSFAEALRGGSDLCDRILFVFDNFETILEPVALFQILKSHIRVPNKLLLTTRFTDFKGHYPVDIVGMDFHEFEELVSTTANRLGIVSLIQRSPTYVRSLHRESWGHPYVVKIVLGQIARDNQVPHKFERVIAKREDILDALFLRSFERLGSDAQRVFFTLCSWRSVIPLVMLEAALMRSSNDEPVDVQQAVEELVTSSMIEILRPENREEPRWINVPTAAFKFGAMRLSTHKSASTVKADRQYISMLGPSKSMSFDAEVVDLGYFFARVEDLLESGAQPEQDLLDIVHYLSSSTPYAWRLAMRTFAEVGRPRDARNVMLRYAPPDIRTWDLDDVRLRFDVLRGLEDSRTVEAALALIRRLLRDGEYGSGCAIVVSFASCFDRTWLKLTAAQKKRIQSEILGPFRLTSKHVDGATAAALMRLAVLCDLPDEVAMWGDIRGIRN